MQYSMVKDERRQPFPKGKGTCQVCGSETVAKCGTKVIWHWAHKSKQVCDPWWENETPWHRDWKEKFPEHCREIVHTCPETNEVHRADIVSDGGIVLEIQNSPISLEELKSREDFYKNLVWLVNGKRFSERFEVSDTILPNPDDPDFEDCVFWANGMGYWRRSENPHPAENPNGLVELYPASKVRDWIAQSYRGHHPFTWKRPHQAWLEASCPVIFDFGQEVLWRLENYRDQFRCVRAIHKERFVWDLMHEKRAADIASRFYPISKEKSF